MEILRQSLEQTFDRPVEIKAEISNLEYAYDPTEKAISSPTTISDSAPV